MVFLLFMAMFLQCLNSSLITVPLPDIANDLGVSLSTSSWLLLAYSLGTCALLLQFAKYSRNNRIKSFFMYGTLIFTMCSFVCGLAEDFGTLVVLRLMQGISISMAAATGPMIVVNKFPDEIKSSALGTMAAGTGLAMVLGPSVGGMLADVISWHYLFWLNVPLGAATFLLAWYAFPKDGEPVEGEDPDPVGSVAWFLTIAFGLTVLENLDEWEAVDLMYCGIVSVLSLLVLILRLSVRTELEPIITVYIVKNKVFLLIIASAMIGSMITEGAMYMIPYFMQVSWNMDVMECGTYFCIVSVTTFLTAKAIGRYCDSHSSKGPVIASFLSTIVFDIIFIMIEPGDALALLVLSTCMVGMSFAVFETAQYLRMIRHIDPWFGDEAATMITVLTYVGASLGLIAYALCFNASIPEAMGIEIDDLSPELMTRGFHATGLLGLILGLIGISLAMLVSGREKIVNE